MLESVDEIKEEATSHFTNKFIEMDEIRPMLEEIYFFKKIREEDVLAI